MKKISKEALSDLVYDQIVRMILNTDLEPGQKINRKELAHILGVSMTPVNEALSRLTQEGILDQKENRDLYLHVFTDEDLIELFAVRAGLEGSALRICLERLEDEQWEEVLSLFDDFTLPFTEDQYQSYRKSDQEFHASILRLSGNRIIQDFIRNFEFIIRCYQKGLIRPPEETLQEHRQIIAAIRRKDSAEAQNLLMNHHWMTRDRLKSLI